MSRTIDRLDEVIPGKPAPCAFKPASYTIDRSMREQQLVMEAQIAGSELTIKVAWLAPYLLDGYKQGHLETGVEYIGAKVYCSQYLTMGERIFGLPGAVTEPHDRFVRCFKNSEEAWSWWSSVKDPIVQFCWFAYQCSRAAQPIAPVGGEHRDSDYAWGEWRSPGGHTQLKLVTDGVCVADVYLDLKQRTLEPNTRGDCLIFLKLVVEPGFKLKLNPDDFVHDGFYVSTTDLSSGPRGVSINAEPVVQRIKFPDRESADVWIAKLKAALVAFIKHLRSLDKVPSS